jgi:exodeoxyribonuclease V alpha subunit
MILNEQQIKAIERATSAERMTLISGSAGTGKTTIIAEICNRLEESEKRVPVLCAFAGKAAARLREATKRNASTIHRLLLYNGTAFQMPVGDLREDTVIVDEASMLDAALLAEIIKRTPKRLVLVGDQAQLPPVGRGQPYHDLLAIRPDMAVNLTRCYRATEAVFQAATAIRSGTCPPSQLTTHGERWALIHTGDAAKTQEEVISWVTDNAGDWDWDTDVVLVPRNGESHEEPSTVAGLNRAIADIVLPRDWGREKWKVGDRVINSKNLPGKDVWNGTTGSISAIDIDNGIWVKTDEPVQAAPGAGDDKMTDRVLFSRSERNHLSLAYALTTHKAQGSQYRRVLVVCLQRDLHCLLERSWIYTSVTRAKHAAVVCGQSQAFRDGIKRVTEKHTVIQELAQIKSEQKH